jgi:hypothetical protein
MNSKRKIIVVSAISIVALGLATGWDVLAGDVWPPEPYQVYSAAGTWIETSDLDQPGDITIVTLSPEDPRTGTGTVGVTEINNTDATMGGEIPDATSLTPWFGTYIKSGPDTARNKLVRYVRRDDKPRPVILAIHVVETTITQTSQDTMEAVGTWAAYSPDSDKDGDGLPDASEQPVFSAPIIQHLKRI